MLGNQTFQIVLFFQVNHTTSYTYMLHSASLPHPTTTTTTTATTCDIRGLLDNPPPTYTKDMLIPGDINTQYNTEA